MISKLGGLRLRQTKPTYMNHILFQSFNEFLELCLRIATEDFRATSDVNLNLNICDSTKEFIETIQSASCIRNLSKVMFHIK